MLTRCLTRWKWMRTKKMTRNSYLKTVTTIKPITITTSLKLPGVALYHAKIIHSATKFSAAAWSINRKRQNQRTGQLATKKGMTTSRASHKTLPLTRILFPSPLKPSNKTTNSPRTPSSSYASQASVQTNPSTGSHTTTWQGPSFESRGAWTTSSTEGWPRVLAQTKDRQGTTMLIKWVSLVEWRWLWRILRARCCRRGPRKRSCNFKFKSALITRSFNRYCWSFWYKNRRSGLK